MLICVDYRFVSQGRIAQLVELLSYTQAVIGSSPVAPKLLQTNKKDAGVVQLVRAPPCHGGSCGFEPRLPRIFFVFLLGLLALLFSCSPQTLNDFKYEGEAISKMLVDELKQIRSRDDLIEHASKLQELFDSLVDVIIQAREFKLKHPQASLENGSHKEQSASDQLRFELNRVLHMEGGREVIEKAQEASLNRLDAYEKLKYTSSN